jgi:hypothetical protein
MTSWPMEKSVPFGGEMLKPDFTSYLKGTNPYTALTRLTAFQPSTIVQFCDYRRITPNSTPLNYVFIK